MTVETQPSTKQRLLEALTRASDERGQVRATSDEIRQAVGLSRHDTLKLLWDLKKEGEITFREGGSRATLHARGITVLKKRGAKMTQVQQLMDYLQKQPADERGWRPYDSVKAARELGLNATSTMVAMSALIKEAGLSIKRGPRGKIQQVRINGTPEPQATERPGPQPEPQPEPANNKTYLVGLHEETPPRPETRLLDEYSMARSTATIMKDNPFLAIEFTANPLADEALSLIDWYRAISQLTAKGGDEAPR